jgi:hypothetical protein
VELKHLEHDTKFNQVFDAIEAKDITPKQGIIYNGQIFDAHVFVSKIIRSAKKSIVLIDNYIDESILTLFTGILLADTIIVDQTGNGDFYTITDAYNVS